MINSGYGICGHKNRYSSRVLEDYWAEERYYPKEILFKPTNLSQSTNITSSADDNNPSNTTTLQKNKQNSNPSFILPFHKNLKNKKKRSSSLSYNILFEHSGAPIGSDRFLTTNQESFQGEMNQDSDDDDDDEDDDLEDEKKVKMDTVCFCSLHNKTV